jgi:AraC-like DNA-binding protein
MAKNYRYYRKDIMDAVKGVKKIIDDNPTIGTSTATLASEAGISSNALQEVFKYKYGTAIGQYRLRIRMAYAKQLLGSGTSIKEIAIILQYSSLSAFTNAFRKYYGQNPSDFQTPRE